MSNNTNNTKLKITENLNEWVEKAITKNCLKYYENKHFDNIQEIGSGKVYRENWKNSNKYLSLKSFFNFNNATFELKLRREVDFHDNVIRFYGIAYSDQENQNDELKKYLLVMEYADGGTLQNFLKEYFDRLNKPNLALQLSYAVSCLNDERIVHHDLHSGNVLVHQNTIKLSDLGLFSKRIEEASNSQSKLYGIIPYFDPKKFNRQGNEISPIQIYLLNEKSDVYSVGMALWEVSSGKPLFHTEGKPYDIDLSGKISQNLKEIDYSNLYTECCDNEPDNHPTMNQAVERSIQSINHSQTVDCDQFPKEQQFNLNNNEVLRGELPPQLTQNFDIETIETLILNNNNLLKKKFEILVDEVVDYIFKLTNEGKDWKTRKQSILDYFNNNDINLQVLYDWILNNQFNLNSIFLFGYFNYSYGIGINENNEKAFNLFIKASEQGHILAQYYVGLCYQFGDGTAVNEKLSFEYYQKVAQDFVAGEFRIGYFYDEGIGIEKDIKLASHWYEKAANKGNIMAMYNLAHMYKDGDGVDVNYNKAFELFKRSSNGGCIDGLIMLGYCYDNGLGINMNKRKAFKLYQKAANLGDNIAQHNLALMYENGDGILQDIDQAIYWYKESAKQENRGSQYKLEKLRLQYRCPPKIFLHKF